MFLYRLQEKKFYFINFLLYVLKIVQITLKRQSQRIIVSVFITKNRGKIDFQFWYFIRTKKTELHAHYPIIEPL